MPHSPEDKKRILTRVRRIRGQVEALERALESGDPCLAILQQIAAVRGAATVSYTHLTLPTNREV